MSDEVVVARKSPYKADLKAGQKRLLVFMRTQQEAALLRRLAQGNDIRSCDIHAGRRRRCLALRLQAHTANRPFCDGSHSSLPE